MNTRSKYDRSPETQSLVEAMRSLEIGQTLTYEQMSELTGGNCKVKPLRDNVQSAVAIVMRDHKISLKNIVGFGYKRQENAEISEFANDRHLKKLRRDTRRYRIRIGCVDEKNLTPEKLQDLRLGRMMVNLREHFVSKKVQSQAKKMTIHQDDPTARLDQNALMNFYKGKG